MNLVVIHGEKDAFTLWHHYYATHHEAIKTSDWDDFKLETEHAFEDVERELRLGRY